MSLSPRVRILAAALVLAVAALAAGFMLLGGSPSSSQAAVKTIKPLHPVNKPAKTGCRGQDEEGAGQGAGQEGRAQAWRRRLQSPPGLR